MHDLQPSQLAIRAGDPILVVRYDGRPTYERCQRAPWPMPGEWQLLPAAAGGEGVMVQNQDADPGAQTWVLSTADRDGYPLSLCWPLPQALSDLVTAVDGKLLARDSRQGGAPGYRKGGGWAFVSTGLGQWTGADMDVLYAAVQRPPRSVGIFGPCSTCRFAVRGHGVQSVERGYAAPCGSCSRPSHDNWQAGECADRSDKCSGGLYQERRKLLCGHHVLQRLGDDRHKANDRRRHASHQLRRVRGSVLPTSARLVLWVNRVLGRKPEPGDPAVVVSEQVER